MAIETTSGSGGGCSPAIGRSIWGKRQAQHTVGCNLLPSPHAHLGCGWRDGPWSADLMLMGAASSPAV